VTSCSSREANIELPNVPLLKEPPSPAVKIIKEAGDGESASPGSASPAGGKKACHQVN